MTEAEQRYRETITFCDWLLSEIESGLRISKGIHATEWHSQDELIALTLRQKQRAVELLAWHFAI